MKTIKNVWACYCLKIAYKMREKLHEIFMTPENMTESTLFQHSYACAYMGLVDFNIKHINVNNSFKVLKIFFYASKKNNSFSSHELCLVVLIKVLWIFLVASLSGWKGVSSTSIELWKREQNERSEWWTVEKFMAWKVINFTCLLAFPTKCAAG